MEYERIHKVQMEVISPSKLKIKLLGSHGVKRKERWNDSSSTSRSKFEDNECSQNSLLTEDFNEEDTAKANHDASSSCITNSEVPTLDAFLICGRENQSSAFRDMYVPKRVHNMDHSASQNTLKFVANPAQTTSNFSTVQPLRSIKEDSHGYDSGYDGASSQSFEFHWGDRMPQHQVVRPFFRNLPSKWNDAERWIVHRQLMHTASSVLKKRTTKIGGSHHAGLDRAMGIPRVAADQKHSNPLGAEKRHKSSSSSCSIRVEKLALVSNCSQSSFDTTSLASGLTDFSAVSSDYSSVPGTCRGLHHSKLCVPQNHTTMSAVGPSVRSVSTRDIGTEITPIPSQEPSRTGTPLDATTPSHSPLSSIPSSPKRGTAAPAPSPVKATNESKCKTIFREIEVSERELQMKTRREIAALSLQLGKMNIASWASKDDNNSHAEAINTNRAHKSEYETRAAAWEETQKSRYIARYKHEEVQIQAWESQQQVKYESKMRRFEAQAEEMKARAQEKMMEKLALTRRRVEQKQATAKTRRRRQAARTSQQVEKIRQTGKIPASRHCCSWFVLG